MKVETHFVKKPQVLDTTLRDGEQTSGVVFSPQSKLTLARELKRLGVDIIEAGSAINGKSEKEAISLVCEEFGSANVTSFARIKNVDIDAVVEAGAGRISLVFPASPIHINGKLRTDPSDYEKVSDIILASADYAMKRGLTVELLAEDGSRAEPEFLRHVALKAQENGVECFCVCDTLGMMMPEQTYALFRYLKDAEVQRLSFHGHNDRDMATANTLAAMRAGAERFHGTVNGLGERTGNCAIERAALALQLNYGIRTINLKVIQEVSTIVAEHSGVFPARCTPVVGDSAFSHAAGIHHDGQRKLREMYEPYPPEIVGRTHKYSLGKLSGTGSIGMKLEELREKGFDVTLHGDKVPLVLEGVRRMGEEGQIVSDVDFLLLVNEANGDGTHNKISIPDSEMLAVTGNRVTPNAYVRLKYNGEDELRYGAAIGDGPVDAVICAINNALGDSGVSLVTYYVGAIKGGSDAKIRVTEIVRVGDQTITSAGFGTDIIRASADAYIKALNVLL